MYGCTNKNVQIYKIVLYNCVLKKYNLYIGTDNKHIKYRTAGTTRAAPVIVYLTQIIQSEVKKMERNWTLFDVLLSELGGDELALSLCKALSTDDMNDCLEYIAQAWGVETESEDED